MSRVLVEEGLILCYDQVSEKRVALMFCDRETVQGKDAIYHCTVVKVKAGICGDPIVFEDSLIRLVCWAVGKGRSDVNKGSHGAAVLQICCWFCYA